MPTDTIHPFAKTSQSFGAWSCMRQAYSCPLDPILHHSLKFVNRITTRITQQLLDICDAVGHHNSSTKRPSGAQLEANLNFDFPQVVRQHTLCAVEYLVCVLFTIAPLFEGERILKIDQVLTKLSPSVGWSTFLGHSVDGTRRAAIDGYASDCCDL